MGRACSTYGERRNAYRGLVGENLSTQRNTCPSASFSTINSTITGLGYQ
jgi:hypothetical protein